MKVNNVKVICYLCLNFSVGFCGQDEGLRFKVRFLLGDFILAFVEIRYNSASESRPVSICIAGSILVCLAAAIKIMMTEGFSLQSLLKLSCCNENKAIE